MMKPAEELTVEAAQVKRELSQKLEIGQIAVVSRTARENTRLQAGRYVTKAQLNREFEDIMTDSWDQGER